MMKEQEILSFMREQAYHPMTVGELEKAFHIENADDFKELVKMLNQLEERGEVVRTRTNRYGVPEKMNLVKGRLQSHPKGFGFVISETPGADDLYIHANDMNGAMHGDIVLARVEKQGGGARKEGRIIRVVERGNQEVVGTFRDETHYGLVIPDDRRLSKDLFIPKGAYNGAVDGHKVVAQITRYPEGRAQPEGVIKEILGHLNDPGVDILSIIRKYGLPEAFPDEVLAEVQALPDEITEAELRDRRDLRQRMMVTIDGADAKDLDDAVSLERLANGHYLLGVHIADVSHYVKENSAMDQEAYRRGTSVYLVDRVIPMLPHRLSNGICSLNPQVDRLAVTCDMEIDQQANVVKHDIYLSVIRTAERMTYADVRLILEEQDEALREKYRELVPMLELMGELCRKLRQKRMNRGAIDFDFREAKIYVNEQGEPTDIGFRTRSIAEQIIEEFMLAANETVAEHFHWLNKPFLYRIHEDPDPEKLQAFSEFVTTLGYIVRGKGNTIHPRALQQILYEAKDTPEETIISTVLLRSMKQARYAAESLGHFGLATHFYTHFTAPIRRYPDLIVHRLIREWVVAKDTDEQRETYWKEKLPLIAEHTSQRERVAVDAERETDDLKKAEYMAERIGEEFEGVISGVTSFGIFVELPNTVEGLVHVSYLTDDYYHYHEKAYALIGERTGKQFRIGDVVRVRVANVNVEERSIDFEIVGMRKSASRGVRGLHGGAGEAVRAGKAARRQKRKKAGRGSVITAEVTSKRRRLGERRGVPAESAAVEFAEDEWGLGEVASSAGQRAFWEEWIASRKKRKKKLKKAARRKRR